MPIEALIFLIIVGALAAFGVLFAMHDQHRKRTDTVVAELTDQIRQMHQRPGLPTHASRELCCAIRRIHPQATPGVDYHLDDEGEGPFIKEWLLDVPEPSDDHLRRALQDHRDDQEKNAYREARRLAYPRIEDQLDALYKARHGDTRELDTLDKTIQRIKAKYPKPEECEEICP